jgi:GT2 family glycosyltransferase
VVVPVRDNTAGARELIERLGEQTLPRRDFEVIVGDDGSHDDSCAVLATNDGWVRVVRGPSRTSYAARNRAAGVAQAGALAFCDSDCLPEPAWLENGLAALERSDMVAGEACFTAPDTPTIWSLLTIDMFLDQKRNVDFSRGVTANLFVTRAVFERLGGFAPSLPSGGDYDFVSRAVAAGASLTYAGNAVVLHPTIDDRRSFLRKVRSTNHWRAVRMARAGTRPSLTALITLAPVLGVAVARREARRPILGLEPSRLMASSLRPDWRTNLRALSRLYFVIAYVAGFAQFRGWLQGRRLGAPVLGDGFRITTEPTAVEVVQTA